MDRTYKYAGFISYSQKDKRWARRIHRALERYRLPTGIAAPEAGPKKRLGRFFRDDDELAGAPSLGSALEGALDESRSLIVICSPNSARSKWVDAEIRRFKSRGPHARVLAVIVEGQPDSDDPAVMCFAPSLLRRVDENGELTEDADEPLAPDVCKDTFNRLIARLVAGLLGLDFDTLWQREKRRIRNRQIFTGVATAAVVVGIGLGTVLYQDAAREARDSARMAAVGELDIGRQPMTAAAVLREVENPEQTAGWMQAALDTLAAAGAADRAVLRGHGRDALSARISEDGRQIVTASMDRTARVWSIGQPSPPVILGPHSSPVVDAGFSPDGSRVWTVTETGEAFLWSAAGNGDAVALNHAGAALSTAGFSPDGTQLITVSPDAARLWRVDALDEPVVLDGDGARIESAVFQPGGERLLLRMTEPHGVRLWRVDGHGEPIDLTGHHDSVTEAVFDADGQRVLTGSADGTVRLWDVASGDALAVLGGHEEGVLRAVFSPRGLQVAALAGDGTIHRWSTESGERLESLTRVGGDGSERWADLSFGEHDSEILAATQRAVYRWTSDTGPQPERITLAGHDGAISSLRLVDDGRGVLTASLDGTARLWRLDGDKTPHRLEGHALGLRSLAFSADGEQLLSAGDDGTARLWQLDQVGAVIELVHDRPVYRAGFARDAGRVMTLTDPGRFEAEGPPAARLWALLNEEGGYKEEPATLARIDTPRPLAAAIAPDGDGLAVAGLGALTLWRSDETSAGLDIEQDFAPVPVYSPDGRQLLVAAGRLVTLLTAGNDGLDERLEPDTTLEHPARVTAAAFSPSGETVATVAEDRIVRLWSLAEPEDSLEFSGHEDRVTDVAFAAGGQLIASGSHDGTVRLWPVTGGSPLILEHPDRVVSVTFSADQSHIMAVTGPALPEPGQATGHPQDRGAAIGESGTGMTLGARTQMATLHLWRLSNNGNEVRLLWRKAGARVAAFNPAGPFLAIGKGDGGVSLWPMDVDHIQNLLWSLTTDCLDVSLRHELLGEGPDLAERRIRECRNHLMGSD